ncbi:MAG: RNA polymerase II-associated protein [Desulfopila sp.]|jgi:hypothetical protein|nr:RNA polymerase II-associated protein [Desulfopila sp.]
MTGSITSTADESTLECRKLHKKVTIESAHCSDPKLYCKFRSSCIIWFMEKENYKQSQADDDSP